MKKYLCFISCVPLLILFLSSCGKITEEIHLNEDGSGEYVIYSDLIENTRRMMTEMMKSFNPDMDEDSLRRTAEAELWKDFPGGKVDSLIDFTNEIPDSVKSDPDMMKIISEMEAFMKGSQKEGFLNMGARFKFKDLDELEAFHNFILDNGVQGNQATSGINAPKFIVDYEFDGKTFSRKSVIKESSVASDSTLNAMALILGQTTTRTIVHLPYKVKKANGKQLVKSSGKEVVYEYSLIGTFKGEESIDFSIQLKK